VPTLIDGRAPFKVKAYEQYARLIQTFPKQKKYKLVEATKPDPFESDDSMRDIDEQELKQGNNEPLTFESIFAIANDQREIETPEQYYYRLFTNMKIKMMPSKTDYKTFTEDELDN